MEKTLAANGWKLAVDLSGGRIVSLSHGETLLLGTFTRADGKKGNTHVCVPNFADEMTAEYGLPFHGPARSLEWKEEYADGTNLTIIAQLPATDKYPAELYVAQEFEAGKDSFIHKITVENAGGETVPVDVGIHNYWATPQGWEGMKVNGRDVAALIRANGSVALRKSNTLTLPDKRIRLKVKNFADAMLWSAGKEGKFDAQYACVEPVFLLDRSDKSTKVKLLKPGGQRILSQEISIL